MHGRDAVDFVNSMKIELSGAFLWISGNSVFGAIYDAVVYVINAVTKKRKNKMRTKKNKNVKSVITGMWMVATLFGK